MHMGLWVGSELIIICMSVRFLLHTDPQCPVCASVLVFFVLFVIWCNWSCLMVKMSVCVCCYNYFTFETLRGFTEVKGRRENKPFMHIFSYKAEIHSKWCGCLCFPLFCQLWAPPHTQQQHRPMNRKLAFRYIMMTAWIPFSHLPFNIFRPFLPLYSPGHPPPLSTLWLPVFLLLSRALKCEQNAWKLPSSPPVILPWSSASYLSLWRGVRGSC